MNKELARRRIQSECDSAEAAVKSAQEQLSAELDEEQHAARVSAALAAAATETTPPDSASLSALPIPAIPNKVTKAEF